MAIPRLITATEILAERNALRARLSYIPHGTKPQWGGYVEISCDCPNCRDHYDPTGVECAKYLNMNPTSFFCLQSDIPCFSFSEIAKESYIANAAPGFYFDDDRLVRSKDELLSEMTPLPRHIFHISKDGVLDRFILSKDMTNWTRHTWKNGHTVYYKDGENLPISHEALRQRLFALF